jgi:hypothetical protein
MSKKRKNAGIIIAIITASSVIVAAIIDVAFRGKQGADVTENASLHSTSQDLHLRIITVKGEPVGIESLLVKKWVAKLAISSDQQALTRSDVLVLANEFLLTERTVHNPQLGFNDGDISFWWEQVKKYRLDEGDLRREFAARRVVLEAADQAGVVIDTQGDLSHFAGEIMADMIRSEKSLQN